MTIHAISINQLRIFLLQHQKRLRAGDRIPSLTSLATIAGVHRDTLYALIAGEKVNERSQYAISKALQTIEKSTANQPSRLMSINISHQGIRLKFGISNQKIFGRN